MKLVSVFFLIMAAGQAWAAPKSFLVESQLFLDGKRVSSPRIGAVVGEESSVKQSAEGGGQRMEMKVYAKEEGSDAVHIRMHFDYSDGSRSINVQPQMMVVNGEAATIEVADDLNEGYKLVVKATPQ